MTTYSSKEITLPASADVVFEKLSNLQNLRSLLDKVPVDKVPEDKRHMFENITITEDSIEVPGGPMGSLRFKVTEKTAPSYIKLIGEGMPIEMNLAMNVKPVSENSSLAKVDINIDIPALLKPMVGGQIQKMADQFGDVLGAISFS